MLVHQNGEGSLSKNRLFGGWFGLTALKQKVFRGWFNADVVTATKYITISVPLREFVVNDAIDRQFTKTVPIRAFMVEV